MPVFNSLCRSETLNFGLQYLPSQNLKHHIIWVVHTIFQMWQTDEQNDDNSSMHLMTHAKNLQGVKIK